MPINTAIYGEVARPDFGNALQALAQGQAIGNGVLQNRLAQMQYQKAQQDMSRSQALDDAYARNTTAKGIDYSGVAGALGQGGAGSLIPGVIKAQHEDQQQRLNLLKTGLEAQKGLAAQVFAAPTQENALSSLDAMEKIYGPGSMDAERQKIIAMGGDTKQIMGWAAGHAMDAHDMLPKFDKTDSGGAVITSRQDPITGDVTRVSSIKKTATPGEILSNKPEEGVPPLTPEAVEAAAHRYLIDGTLPPMGMGKGGAVGRTQILNRAAAIAKQDGTAPEDQRGSQLANKSQAQALGQLAKQRAMIDAFDSTATANAGIALEYSKKVDRTNTPIFNRWLLAGRKATGDADVAAFDAANQTFANEYAKIMSGSMGNTVVTDSARKHAFDMMNTAQSPEQYQQVMNVLLREKENRIKGLDDQVQKIRSGFSGKSSAVQATQSPTQQTAPHGYTSQNEAYQDYLKAHDAAVKVKDYDLANRITAEARKDGVVK